MKQHTLALTSVTFRSLGVDQVIALAKEAGLDGIEWGGDIHVPMGDLSAARIAGEKTSAAGLSVLSYGSYYTLKTFTFTIGYTERGPYGKCSLKTQGIGRNTSP